MIEREFIREKTKYLKVKEHINSKLDKAAGIGRINIEKTPMGEKIIIDAVKPGLVIGRGGQTISGLTLVLKEKFKLENPQIEVHEIVIPAKCAAVVAKKIAADLERFGPARFKAIGYRSLSDIMNAGALGAEITISGRGVPSSKAMKWRFPIGYMKKSGQIALEFIDKAEDRANLRSGTVGIKVAIMHPDTPLPDKVKYREIAEIQRIAGEAPKPEAKPAAEKPKRTRTARKKSTEPTVEKAPEGSQATVAENQIQQIEAKPKRAKKPKAETITPAAPAPEVKV